MPGPSVEEARRLETARIQEAGIASFRKQASERTQEKKRLMMQAIQTRGARGQRQKVVDEAATRVVAAQKMEESLK